MMTAGELRKALHNPAIYPEPTSQVTVYETHISIVFVTDRYAYKIKKPVNLGFLDYSTLAKRRFYCLQELLLNRRLSPDVYLEVVPLYRDQQCYTFQGEGPVVDYVLKMRRLPADSTLEARLQRGLVSPQLIEDLAHLLASFHATHPLPAGVENFGTLSQIRGDWQENFAQTASCIGVVLPQHAYTQIQQAVMAFMALHAPWFAQRLQAGRIRDCHGDLRAAHIYLLNHDQIRIIDCIEFNKRFRFIDVASEVAFLAMDIERLGFPAMAHHFVRTYVHHSGDVALYRLLDFYACYRAYVRGKVAWMRLCETSQQQSGGLRRETEGCFQLAARVAARLTRPLLIITTGLIGSGKSRVAESVAAALDVQVFSSDRLRKALVGLRPTTSHHVAYGEGIYCPAISRRTYATLARLADQTLRQGRSVILDAAFSRRADRQRMAALARDVGADFCLLECRAPEEIIRQRLAARAHAHGTISDGRWEIFPHFQRHYQPVHEDESACHIRLETTQTLETCVQQVLATIQEGRP